MARRRKRGTGSITRRKDGLYIAQVSLGKRPDGKRDRRSFSSRNRGDIDFWLRETLRGHARGDDRAASTLTVEDYLSDWLDAVTPTVRPTTARGYAIHIRKWIVPVIGGEPLIGLDPADVRRVLALMTKAGRSPRTAHSVFVTLRMALTAAVRDGRLERNVADGVKAPRSTRPTVSATTPDEARLIRAASDTSIRGSMDRPAVRDVGPPGWTHDAAFCPFCGTKRVGYFRFCPRCDYDFEPVYAASPASQPALTFRIAARETAVESTGRSEMVQAVAPVRTGGTSSSFLARRVAPAAPRVIVLVSLIAALALGSGYLIKTAGLCLGFTMLAHLAYRELQWPEADQLPRLAIALLAVTWSVQLGSIPIPG